MGGLPKKTHSLHELRKRSKELLAVDAGALLFKEEQLPAGQEQQLKTTAMGIVSAYNETGFQAVGVSRQDLAAGLAFLLEVQKHSQFSWVSSNLVNKRNGKHHFAPHTLVKAGQLTVAILGLTGEGNGSIFSPEDDALILPWQQALLPQIAQVQGKADMLILLSNYPEEENRKIAAAHPEIHLLVQAGTRKENMEPTLVNNTLITQVEQQGKYVALLNVSWNKTTRRWHSPEEKETLLKKKNELDRTLWLIGRHQRKGDPLTLYSDDPASMQLYKELLLQKDILVAEVKLLEDKEARKDHAAFSAFTFRFSPMNAEIPDDHKVRSLVDATTREVNSLNRKAAAAGSQDRATASGEDAHSGYAGSSSCTPCHAGQEKKWLKTRHARAYDTLEKREQQFNTNCVPCHVTGALALPPAAVLRLGKELQQVGCESCHGPAGRHASSPESQKPAQPTASACLNCHTREHDDNFDFATDLARLNCGN